LANSLVRITHTINVLEAELAAARQRIEELETALGAVDIGLDCLRLVPGHRWLELTDGMRNDLRGMIEGVLGHL